MNLSHEISHYYCELSELAIRQKDLPLAKEHLTRALEKWPTSPRANIAMGALLLLQGEEEEVLERWEGVAKETPDYLPLVIGQIADLLYKRGERIEAVKLLHSALASSTQTDVIQASINRLAQWEGQEVVLTKVVELLKKSPSLSTFAQMIALRQEGTPQDEESKLLLTLLEKQARKESRYQCAKCGYMFGL